MGHAAYARGTSHSLGTKRSQSGSICPPPCAAPSREQEACQVAEAADTAPRPERANDARRPTLSTNQEASLAASRSDLNRRIRTYAHADGKLKGFGAAAVVRVGPNRSSWGDEYRLFCGRGIKNIHVWSFRPEHAMTTTAEGNGRRPDGIGRPGMGRSGSGGWGAGGEWTCLFDTHTNGATVELVAFRNGGFEGISKVRIDKEPRNLAGL